MVDSNKITILAVDPSTTSLGYALYSSKSEVYKSNSLIKKPLKLNRQNLHLCDYGYIKPKASLKINERLQAIYFNVTLQKHFEICDKFALEEAFLGKHAHAILGLGLIRGMLFERAFNSKILARDIIEYAPATIKKCICGKGNANKETVAKFVLMQLGLNMEEDKDLRCDDVTDSLAIGMVCCRRLGYL